MTLLLIGYALAALFLGLWWGERGRRIDAQIRESVIPQRKRKAVVRDQAPAASIASEEGQESLDSVREELIEACMAEGHSRKDCEVDVDRMLGKLATGVDDRSREW